MQSKFFFTLLFLSLGLGFLHAQDQADLSLEYKEGEGVKGELWLSTDLQEKTILLRLFGAEVDEVRLSQGRLKQALNYRFSKDTLLIQIPSDLDKRSRIYIAYHYTWEQLAKSPFVELLEPGMVFNAFNLEEGARSATPGWIIPSRLGSYDMLKIGLLFPRELNPELPLEADYEIELDESQKLIYYRSNAPVDLSAFYLVFGDFRRFDPEDVLEDLQENEALLARSRLAQFEANFQGVLTFVSHRYGQILTDENLQTLSDLEPQVAPQGFWTEGLEKQMNLDQQNRSYSIIASFEKGDLFTTWLQYAKGLLGVEQWRQNLKKHFENGDTSQLFWSYLMEGYLEEKGLSWQDSLKVSLSENQRMHLSIAKTALKRKKPLDFKLSYRFKSSREGMEFYLEQPDSNVSISGSLDLRAVLKDTIINTIVPFEIGTLDTVFVPISESPRSIYISPVSSPFLRFLEERPLSYWLYDLNKAPSGGQKREALIKLLEIANPNLLATVIGIALDSGEPELQLLALSRVNDLRVDGLKRLESTLKSLAKESSNVKLMQKADSLVKEYWPE